MSIITNKTPVSGDLGIHTLQCTMVYAIELIAFKGTTNKNRLYNK